MKSIFKITGMTIVACVLYFSSGNVNVSKTDVSLSTIIANNVANAKIVPVIGCHYTGNEDHSCTAGVYTISSCKAGTESDCGVEVF